MRLSGILIVCGFLFWAGKPVIYYFRAQALIVDDPTSAEELFGSVVAFSGDRYPNANLLWCRSLVRSGRWEEALGCFSQVSRPEHADSDVLLELANDAISARVPLLAVMSLEAIPADSKNRPDALNKLIGLRKERGDFAGVLSLAEELTNLQPENAQAWREMAVAHEQLMLLSAAAADYREFLDRERSPIERQSGLKAIIRILIHLGERDEARQRYDELASMMPLYTPGTVDLLNEAQLLRLEGDIQAAQDLVSKILQGNPKSVPALLLRGTLAMDKQDYISAEPDFQKVVALQPLNKQGRYKLAVTLTRLGRKEDASPHFEENRRIQILMDRILELRKKQELSPEEQAELVAAFEKTGLHKLANQHRARPSQRP